MFILNYYICQNNKNNGVKKMKFETINDKLTVTDLLLIQYWETLGKVNILEERNDQEQKTGNKKLSAFWKRYNKLLSQGKSKKQARKLAKLNN